MYLVPPAMHQPYIYIFFLNFKQCNCKNGFSPSTVINGMQNCDDIDECSGVNICDENANCHNDLGGYSCVCRDGYTGNGYTCSLPRNDGSMTPSETKNSDELLPENLECSQCSENAECFNNVCVCKNGWSGDGIVCNYNCQYDSVWSIDRCVPSEDEDEIEVVPFCTLQGCSCSTGYKLIEYATGQLCRLMAVDDDTSSNGSIDEDRGMFLGKTLKLFSKTIIKFNRQIHVILNISVTQMQRVNGTNMN